MESRYPDFFDNSDYFEISLDFWEKMEQSGHENELKLFEVVDELGFLETTEARQNYSRTLKSIQEAHSEWIQTIREIRERVNPKQDRLFYYYYSDKKESSNSNDGIFVVRHGRMREKFVLNGQGARLRKESAPKK